MNKEERKTVIDMVDEGIERQEEFREDEGRGIDDEEMQKWYDTRNKIENKFKTCKD